MYILQKLKIIVRKNWKIFEEKFKYKNFNYHEYNKLGVLFRFFNNLKILYIGVC